MLRESYDKEEMFRQMICEGSIRSTEQATASMTHGERFGCSEELLYTAILCAQF